MSGLDLGLGTLGFWQWALLLAIPPAIFLLYFLKLKRHPIEVPSTYLWHRTIEDLHVNSLWQRLRQSLLLFLQLLFVLLLILACLNFTWSGEKLTEKRLIFLIDTSGSMSATDESPSRLQRAKQQSRQLIEQMRTGEVAMLVSFSDRARIEQPFTEDRRLLVRKLERIRPTQRTSNLDEALRVAAGLANPGHSGEDPQDLPAAEAQPAMLLIYSDGGFRQVPEVALGNLRPRYISLGKPTAQNVGIVAFDTSRPLNPNEPIDVFGRIQNFTDQPQQLTASFFVDDQLEDAKQLRLPAGEAGGVSFRLAGVVQGILKLELEIDDDLELDNVAYAVVNPPRRSRLLVVTAGNEPLEIALATEYLQRLAYVETITPDQMDQPDYTTAATAGTYDLIVYDRCNPPTPPRANTLYLGAVPEQDGWQAEPSARPPLIIDTARTHPLMQFVQMSRVLIDQSQTLTGPPGSTVIVDADQGAIAVLGPREGYQDLVLGFPLVRIDEDGDSVTNTDWPIRISFPLFFSNALRHLGGAASSQERAWVRPGQPLRLRWPTAVTEATVTTPAGERLKASLASENSFLFGATGQLGVYRAEPHVAEGLEPFHFAVNLFDSVESDIAPKELIQTEYEAIEAQPQLKPERRAAWRYLLLVGLGVMLFEWYVYNRRVYL